MQGQHHDDTDSDDEWTDDEEEATALDQIDPFIAFAQAVTAIQVCIAACSAVWALQHAVFSSAKCLCVVAMGGYWTALVTP